MRYDAELMNASLNPYCRLCRYQFDLGDSALDHLWKEHKSLLFEIAEFQRFMDMALYYFISNTKIDEEDAKDKAKREKNENRN